MNEPAETYSIADLAREFDVTHRAIRFYEDEGLLSPGRDGTRRVYSKRDWVRLKLILRGKRLGFSLAEIREMLELYDSAPDDRPQLEKFVAARSSSTSARKSTRCWGRSAASSASRASS